MAVSFNPFDGTAAAVTSAGTSVAPTLAPPDNCTTVVLLNPSATETVYFGLGSAGGALAPLSSGIILSKSSVTIPVGELSIAQLILDATAAVTVHVLYINGENR